MNPECRLGKSDVHLLYGIRGLSFDSPFLPPALICLLALSQFSGLPFFCFLFVCVLFLLLLLLLFANSPCSLLFSPENSPTFFIKDKR